MWTRTHISCCACVCACTKCVCAWDSIHWLVQSRAWMCQAYTHKLGRPPGLAQKRKSRGCRYHHTTHLSSLSPHIFHPPSTVIWYCNIPKWHFMSAHSQHNYLKCTYHPNCQSKVCVGTNVCKIKICALTCTKKKQRNATRCHHMWLESFRQFWTQTTLLHCNTHRDTFHRDTRLGTRKIVPPETKCFTTTVHLQTIWNKPIDH